MHRHIAKPPHLTGAGFQTFTAENKNLLGKADA